MTKEERKELLAGIQEKQPFATGYQLLYRGSLQPFNVWEIPLDALIYNQYNGRIGSVVKSFENQNHKLEPEKAEDSKIIENFLWESKISANTNTLDSLRKTGQIKFGIVTCDGLIIDGNRRASLMNRIRHSNKCTQEEKDRCAYFKAVILPDSATKKDILQLETSFQMGEDQKVDYNPIEKYLKCKDLEDAGFTRDEIASFMGIAKKDVDLNLEILELMDQYLAYNDYDGIYTLANGHEDSFQKLNAAMKQYKQGVANMWAYTETDLNDMLCVAFDYIRLNLPQNDIRDIFRKPGKKSNSIFGDKERWNKFFEKHQQNLSTFQEKPVDEYISHSGGEDITKCLKARDEEWKKKMESLLVDTFEEAQDEIDSQMKANAPVLLVNKAQGALDSIDSKSQGFTMNATVLKETLEKLITKAQELKDALNG